MQEAEKVRVGIIAADPLRALGLQSILQEMLAMEPIVCDLQGALADGGLNALLLDDRFETQDVLATVTRLLQERPDWKLIVLGEALDVHSIETLVRAGARGYLLETSGEAEIRRALDAVLGGSVWAPPKVLARLAQGGGVVSADAVAEPHDIERTLTARELQVLELLIDGQSNREIGQKLGIDEATVKAHLGRMLRKTRSKNRVDLTLRVLEARTAGRNGLSAEV